VVQKVGRGNGVEPEEQHDSSGPNLAEGIGNARHRRIEMFATILLAVAAVATAWSTYQSTHWRGQQAERSNRATAAHIASAEASTRAGQLTQIDINTFSQWVDADVTGDDELAEFYRMRFRAEFRPAFDAWMATDPLTNPNAPKTPFEMPEYRLEQAEQATRLNTAAASHTHEAKEAMQRADDYMLAVVVFATALFFAGISSRFDSRRRREALLVVGAISFLGAAIWVTTLYAIDTI
jgi:hypothetical protein